MTDARTEDAGQPANRLELAKALLSTNARIHELELRRADLQERAAREPGDLDEIDRLDCIDDLERDLARLSALLLAISGLHGYESFQELPERYSRELLDLAADHALKAENAFRSLFCHKEGAQELA